MPKKKIPAPTTVQRINEQTAAYAPAVLEAIEAAEQNGGTGASKLGQALKTLTGVSGAVAQIPKNPEIAGYAALVNFAVALVNHFGGFDKPKKK